MGSCPLEPKGTDRLFVPLGKAYMLLTGHLIPGLPLNQKMWFQVKSTVHIGLIGLVHGHQSSSFIAKCNNNKFICGTSHFAAAEFETCKRLRVLLFYYQLLLL